MWERVWGWWEGLGCEMLLAGNNINSYSVCVCVCVCVCVSERERERAQYVEHTYILLCFSWLGRLKQLYLEVSIPGAGCIHLAWIYSRMKNVSVHFNNMATLLWDHSFWNGISGIILLNIYLSQLFQKASTITKNAVMCRKMNGWFCHQCCLSETSVGLSSSLFFFFFCLHRGLNSGQTLYHSASALLCWVFLR
jgi:hypothetical protein